MIKKCNFKIERKIKKFGGDQTEYLCRISYKFCNCPGEENCILYQTYKSKQKDLWVK